MYADLVAENMSKIGESLLQGASEALEYAKGDKKGSKTNQIKIPEKIDVKAIREKLNMTRSEFASRFGIPLRTLEKWEQGARQPEGSARAYLVVINQDPQAVVEALRKSQ